MIMSSIIATESANFFSSLFSVSIFVEKTTEMMKTLKKRAHIKWYPKSEGRQKSGKYFQLAEVAFLCRKKMAAKNLGSFEEGRIHIYTYFYTKRYIESHKMDRNFFPATKNAVVYSKSNIMMSILLRMRENITDKAAEMRCIRQREKKSCKNLCCYIPPPPPPYMNRRLNWTICTRFSVYIFFFS